MTEETGFEKDIKRLENEKTKLNDRLSNLVDMKLDKIIDNDTYVKKEKELLNKIDEANEKLNAYFKDLNLKGSRIATVGSSGDQVLNAIFYGAKDITLIDANIFTRAYFEYKTAMIKNLNFDEFKSN